MIAGSAAPRSLGHDNEATGGAASYVVDLDGVVWLGGTPIPGAVDAVNSLIQRGDRVAFVTNSSWHDVTEQEARLERIGVAGRGRVLTSAQAAAECLDPGARVAVLGGDGIREALTRRGIDVVPLESETADAVVVGIARRLTYESLSDAARLVRGGARFVLTNGDVTYPTEAGLEPGAGTIGAAVAAASGVRPEVVGKPDEAMASFVRGRLGSSGWVIGDRPDTDGLFAVRLGYRFALVLSGVTGAGDLPVSPTPDLVATDLASAVGEIDQISCDAG